MSKNTKIFADLLAARVPLTIVDTSPGQLTRGSKYHLRRITKVLRGLLTIIGRSRRKPILYVPVEHSGGAFYTLAVVLAARVARATIYLHHRSFFYIDNPKGPARVIAKLSGPRSTHVFLCDCMRERFEGRYGTVNSRTLSNLSTLSTPITDAKSSGETVTLGLLSNLSRSKGAIHFLDLALALQDEPGIAFVLGGGADAEVTEAITAAQKVLGDKLTWLGPVYGAERDAMMASTDLFVFPTEYPAEAQPNVVFEAAATGAIPITLTRGCIGEDMEWLQGFTFDDPSAFVTEASAVVRRLAADLPGREARITAMLQVLRDGKASADEGLTSLIDDIVAGV